MEATRRMAKCRSLASSTKSGAPLSFSITSILSSGEFDGEEEEEEEIDVGNEDAETDDERVTAVQGRMGKHAAIVKTVQIQ